MEGLAPWVIALVTIVNAVTGWILKRQQGVLKAKVEEIHCTINSRLTEMIQHVQAGAFAEGNLAGVAQEQARQKEGKRPADQR